MLSTEELQSLTTFLVRDNEKVKAIGVWEAVLGIGNTNTSCTEKSSFFSLEEWAGRKQPVYVFGRMLSMPGNTGTAVRILAVVADVVYLKIHDAIHSIPLGERYSVSRGIAYDTELCCSIWGVIDESRLTKEDYVHP